MDRQPASQIGPKRQVSAVQSNRRRSLGAILGDRFWQPRANRGETKMNLGEVPSRPWARLSAALCRRSFATAPGAGHGRPRDSGRTGEAQSIAATVSATGGSSLGSLES